MAGLAKFQRPINIKKYDEDGNEKKENINKLYQYLDAILSNIGIKDSGIIVKIKLKFANYNETSYKLLENSKITELIDDLLEKDKILNRFITTQGELFNFYQNENDFKKNWDNLMNQFATLQGLIIIKKVTKNIDTGIESLISALADKLNAANNLMEKNLFDE